MAKKQKPGTMITLDVATYYYFRDDVIQSLPREAQIMMLEFGLAVTVDAEGNTRTWYDEGIPGTTRDMGVSALWDTLCTTDTLVGYNIRAFDLPLLYFETVLAVDHRPGWPTAHIVDLFATIRAATGKEYPLQYVANATLGRGKSTTLQQSAEWLRKGETQLVAEKCAQDVSLTRDLYLQVLAGEPIVLPRLDTAGTHSGYRLWIDRLGNWTRLEPFM